MNVFKKALVATVASAFVVSGGGVMATAQPAGNPATNAQAAAASIDASRTATLHIHKYSGDPVPGAQNNGLEQTVNGQRDPLAGAQFRIERVTNVDLKTAAGWLQAEQIAKNAQGAPTPTYGEGQSVTTDQNGAATVNNLPLGLYRVTEVAAPARHTKAEPFFVTLPLTHPQERNAWLYDVHVYPKNKKDDRPLTKTVADVNKNAGDVIDYRLSSPIPDYERLARFQIQDIYPQDRLEFPAQGQEGRKVEVTAGGTNMTEGTDYVVTDNAPQPGRLTIAFTRTGLDKLDALPRGENPDQRQVTAVVSFRVKEVTGETLGPIENTFNVVENPDGDPSVPPNTPPETPATPPENPPTPEETPKTYHGNVRVIKKNSGDENLAGAEFDVFRCNDVNSLQGDAIKKVTTGENGEALIQGLHVNDFVDGAASTSTPSGYCLVETKSPEGYELQPGPIYFQVLRGSGDVDTVALVSQTVTDVPKNGGFNLPLTGGNGVWLILAVGGLLVVMGGGYYYVAKRRETA